MNSMCVCHVSFIAFRVRVGRSLVLTPMAFYMNHPVKGSDVIHTENLVL